MTKKNVKPADGKWKVTYCKPDGTEESFDYAKARVKWSKLESINGEPAPKRSRKRIITIRLAGMVAGRGAK